MGCLDSGWCTLFALHSSEFADLDKSCSLKGTGHWTLLVIVKDQYSHLVYPNTCLKKQTCKNLELIVNQSYKRIMREKTLLLNKFVWFLMPKKASGLKSFNIWVRNLFLKNYFNSVGAVSQMCNTITNSLLVVTK